MKRIGSLNFYSRFVFFILTPVFFQYFALGFIWHSIYWGVITFVMLIWSGFIILSPLFGRIGCGWFCFMGTASDIGGKHSILKTKWKKPIVWSRILLILMFFISSIAFHFINKERGITHGFDIVPGFIKPVFDAHYKYIWIMDTGFAIVISLFLDKRWMCKNLCVMGTMCSLGARYSRLIPVVDKQKCTECRKCEKVCLPGIPIVEYVKNNHGLVTNPECVNCRRCVDACKFDAVHLQFVWNRKKYTKKPI